MYEWAILAVEMGFEVRGIVVYILRIFEPICPNFHVENIPPCSFSANFLFRNVF